MTETKPQTQEPIDPATVMVLLLLDAGFDIEDIDWPSVSEMRRVCFETF